MFILFLLVLNKSVIGLEKSKFKPELVCLKEDYDSVEEVKGHDNETSSEKIVEDEFLLREAILDVAYYLRRFKFNGFDPRYLTEEKIPQKKFYAKFPSPPLRNVQWEVKKNCESSFVECVKYLQEQISQTVLPRHLDSLTEIKQNGWNFYKDEVLIKTANDKCLKLLEADEKSFGVFYGPLQKFQWLTSASYYMCWYTMKEVSYLKVFAEDCDNFASCIHVLDVSPNNGDFRGNNTEPYACALYSFCPDPCCPYKHLRDPSMCLDVSPCSASFSTDRRCSLSKQNNVHMESMMLNQWNVSCSCDRAGMRWDSKSGMCVDIDECIELESACRFPVETCLNIRGSYKCICNHMDYLRNPETNDCEPDPVLQKILYPPYDLKKNETESLSNKFTDAIKKFKYVMSNLLENYNLNFSNV